MPEIKINVTADDLARLNAEAAAHGMPRAHLIRQRALSGGVVAGLPRRLTMRWWRTPAHSCVVT